MVEQLLKESGNREDTGKKYRILAPYLRGYGPTRFLAEDTIRSGEQAALAKDVRDFMDALGISRAILAGFDWGGRAACIVSALWPDRVLGLVSCGAGYNVQNPLAFRKPAVSWHGRPMTGKAMTAWSALLRSTGKDAERQPADSRDSSRVRLHRCDYYYTRVAEAAGIHRSLLYKKMAKYRMKDHEKEKEGRP